MDENLLEFWGNFLLSTARKKKQVDDMTAWMQKGFNSFDDLSGMFRKFYGLDQLSEHSTEYKKMTEKAMEDFQKSFKEYMGSLAFVPKKEHLSLVDKYEKLKEKCADQEETIKHLKMLMNARGTDQLQEIIRDQGEVFQTMMKGFTQYFTAPEKAESSKEGGENKQETKTFSQHFNETEKSALAKKESENQQKIASRRGG